MTKRIIRRRKSKTSNTVTKRIIRRRKAKDKYGVGLGYSGSVPASLVVDNVLLVKGTDII
jgi:hypothetical protein